MLELHYLADVGVDVLLVIAEVALLDPAFVTFSRTLRIRYIDDAGGYTCAGRGRLREGRDQRVCSI
jgi:hypothetical protein